MYVKRSRNTKPVDLKTTKSSSFVGEGKKERGGSKRPDEDSVEATR